MEERRREERLVSTASCKDCTHSKTTRLQTYESSNYTFVPSTFIIISAAVLTLNALLQQQASALESATFRSAEVEILARAHTALYLIRRSGN